MATVHSVVELNGNGTIRGVVLSTFNKGEAEKFESKKNSEGANNRRYVTLSGKVTLPKKKEDA